MNPKEGHAAHKLCNYQEHELIHSQLGETNPIQVADHCAHRNSQERGRYQQLGNENSERHTQDDCERSQL